MVVLFKDISNCCRYILESCYLKNMHLSITSKPIQFNKFLSDGKRQGLGFVALAIISYTRTGGWEFDRSHGSGISSPSH